MRAALSSSPYPRPEPMHQRGRSVLRSQERTRSSRLWTFSNASERSKDGLGVSERAIEIYEHSLLFDGLSNELKTSFNSKEPFDEVKVRLTRDGPNMLTPPKKKVHSERYVLVVNHLFASQHDFQFLDQLFTMFKILLMVAGVRRCPRICPTGNWFSRE